MVEDYVLFDCPGQVELFTHHGSLRNVFLRIQKMGYRVCLPSPHGPLMESDSADICIWF